MNESLKDQIRLLKNQLNRQRQEFEETIEDLRKELAIKESALLCQKSQNETIMSTSAEKKSSLPRKQQFSSDKEDHDDCLTKKSSDIEVGRLNRIFVSFMSNTIYQDTNHFSIL